MPIPEQTQPRVIDALYLELLDRGITYFLPDVRVIGSESADAVGSPAPRGSRDDDGSLALAWLGSAYALTRERGRGFSAGEAKLIKSISKVLWARYQVLFDSALMARSFDAFRGQPEDRYVSAFLDPSLYASAENLARSHDRVADAIEVLRVTSSSTYENRRIATGVLLFGSLPDPCHPLPPLPAGALRYSNSLTSSRSFHRLCDGLQTVALVDRAGLMVELVDVHEWTVPFGDVPLPVPTAARYQAHSQATVCGGHVCLVLTPNGEIKIFADGVQVFNFLDGRWRLTDAAEKYAVWEQAVGDPKLAERLFTAALNLAEHRRGGLFVILDDREAISRIVAPRDLLASEGRTREDTTTASKEHFHYLLRDTRVTELAQTVLESVARIDGGIVLDRGSHLLAFGAILRQHAEPGVDLQPSEGGRTTAAIHASRVGNVLKVSEDGLISFFQSGQCVWEI